SRRSLKAWTSISPGDASSAEPLAGCITNLAAGLLILYPLRRDDTGFGLQAQMENCYWQAFERSSVRTSKTFYAVKAGAGIGIKRLLQSSLFTNHEAFHTPASAQDFARVTRPTAI